MKPVRHDTVVQELVQNINLDVCNLTKIMLLVVFLFYCIFSTCCQAQIAVNENENEKK